MFTAEQIREKHSRVRTGADFPAYIREIKDLGVTHYEAYVSDGHIDYHGVNNAINLPAKYEPVVIAETANVDAFKAELSAHQQGKTDFLTFIKMCAIHGVKKWAISMRDMTCTYYDKADRKILVEEIPNYKAV